MGLDDGVASSSAVLFSLFFLLPCSYVTKSDWEKNKFYNDGRFMWLIPHDLDTTVHNSDCAYDRYLAGCFQIGSMLIIKPQMTYI